ncbi:MAG: hypothetical protein P4L33_06305 [Capsulimonadaceae bacterium]|nr:hypothetical protein [Capsulimonadaceae bacterium]
MGNPKSKPDGSFLGKGELKFNQAGNNAPLPGEKIADAAPALLFGGPKRWAGIAIIIVALILLFAVYSAHNGSMTAASHRQGVAPEAPSDNPDVK